jgi:hypothetical protein
MTVLLALDLPVHSSIKAVDPTAHFVKPPLRAEASDHQIGGDQGKEQSRPRFRSGPLDADARARLPR